MTRSRIAPAVLLLAALPGLTGALLNGDLLLVVVFAAVGIAAVVLLVRAIRMGRGTG